MSKQTSRPIARLRVHAADDDFSIHGAEWSVFWQRLRRRLLKDSYRLGTLRVYRQVLRDLRTFLRQRHGVVRPDGITPQTAESYLVFLSQKNVSWSWMASAIAVLRSRTVVVPRGLRPLFEGLAAISRNTDPMITGRPQPDAAPLPLSVRQAERLIQAAGKRAGILKRVSPQILRHSYALRRLIAGDNIREVQVALGHHCVRTTLRYQACIPPKVVSPADPEPPEVTLKHLASILDRLNTYAETMASAGFAKGP